MYVKTYILIRRKDKFIGTFIDGCVVRIFRDKAYSFPLYFMDKCFYELWKAFIEQFFFFEKKPQKRKTSLVPISYANILTEFSHELYRKI